MAPPPSQGVSTLRRGKRERERERERERDDKRDIEREMIILSFIPHKGLNRYKGVDTQGCKPPWHSHLVTHSHLFVYTTLTLIIV